MHECGSGSPFIVNAEVDSMGGVVEGGVGIGIKTSPRNAAIEKAQAELRQEYDVREERRRELEFLEKGGNPLDFKFGNAAAVSVQSTSLNDHQAEHIVTSEAKGSFALTESPHGDSVESSGRPLVPTLCEPNSADNFNGDNSLLEHDRKSKHFNRRNSVAPSEQSSQMDGTSNVKESEDSAIVHSYIRRNRSRPSREGTRLSSTDVVQSSGGHGLSLQVRAGSRESKGLKSETNNCKDQSISSASNLKTATSNGDVVPQVEILKMQSNKEVGGVQALEIKVESPKSSLPEGLDVAESNITRDKPYHQDSKVETRIDIACGENNFDGGKELVIAGVSGCPAVMGKNENETTSAHMNGLSDLKRDCNEGQNGIPIKGLDSESSCTQSSLGLDVNHDSDLLITGKNDDANGVTRQTSEFDGTQNLAVDKMGNEQNDAKAVEDDNAVNRNNIAVYENHSSNSSVVKIEEEMQITSDVKNDVNCPNNDEVEQKVYIISETDKEVGNELGDDSNPKGDCCGGIQCTLDCSKLHVLAPTQPVKSSSVPESLSCSGNELKLVDRACEDSILEEARIIEAKRQRIAELSIGTKPLEACRKSHWDFVLEEMAWLANDFAQERLWKTTAAAQICRRVAFTFQLRAQNQQLELKKVAYTLAKAVMQFWHSVELFTNSDNKGDVVKHWEHDSRRFDAKELSEDKIGGPHQEQCKQLTEMPTKNFAHAIREYAVRFLKCHSSPVPSVQAEAPATPDRVADLGIMEVSWDDQFTEESLFYAVPAGAMETYRASIESYLSHCKKTASSMQEEVDTSMCDGAADFGYHENAYDEEEGETSTYYLHGSFEGSKSTKHDQKKHKRLMKSYSSRSYDLGGELPYGHNSVGCQQNNLMGKRPSSTLHVGPVPPKRMRTASRQRFIIPFGAGTPGVGQTPAKTDASSGDTSSFQEDQSTLHCGSQILKSMEIESAGEFEKRIPHNCTEASTKPKKKKAKNLGSAYEQGRQLESIVHSEQRDNLKKRLDGHQFESDGTSGLHGQHAAKKPKVMKQSLENSFDNMAPITGSVPSPAASQMSNMSNHKFMKLIGRERGKKAKTLKISVAQPGSGSPWSLFEDQALVVLVHDMGPNWELVSDAINSTLQFKCIFRKPKECKDRHKILMDKGAGDGADSAEDSGSSQSYPSTLPGIPKNDGQDPKQLAAVHNSHAIALAQACPNDLSGVVLTPLDLSDANTSNPDSLSLGYQGSQVSGLAMPNQGSVSSMLPTSGANSPIQGSPGIALGNSSPMQSGAVNTPGRDGRYNVGRHLSVDEQQRMPHYNQLLSNRNLQQSNMPVSGSLPGADRGVCVVPGGNGTGMMPGMNRSMPMSRPGFQVVHSSSLINSGSMLSSSMVGMSSPVNVHQSGQGNSLRPRETLHVTRHGHNPEHQRSMIMLELQMQMTPPVQTYAGHSQQQNQISSQQSNVLGNHLPHPQGPNHGTGSTQQAYAIHLSKERQMQQRLLQQQQFANSNALMSHAQPQSQPPISSSVQNSSHIQLPNLQQPVSLAPLTPSSPITQVSVQQQKHNLTHHGLSRNSQTGVGGLTNPSKQRQWQPQQQQQFHQLDRQHPHQRQHSQSPQQPKILKGRGNMMVHQNLSIDHSHSNGLSMPAGNQGAEKGEQMMHLMHGQGLYSGTNLGPIQPSKPLLPSQTSNNSQPQQKVFSGATPPPQPSKQLQQITSHSDGTQASVTAATNAANNQAVPTQLMASNHQHQQQQLPMQPHQKQINQAQSNVQRILQQNPQTDKVHMDQQSLQNSAQLPSRTSSLCNDSATTTPVSTAIPHWKSSEPLYDNGVSNPASQVGSIGSPSLPNSVGTEPVTRCLGQRQSLGSFGQHGHSAATLWPQQQQPSNHSTIPPQPSQHVFQPQEQQLPQESKSPPQLPLQQQSQQQKLHPQSAQGNLYVRPSNS
ncbi:hypothetical protein K2173_012837 [Erythroxylum novogranatense]|uniref:Uncharacterized protein n=1 Tax=Erythroxylum novogranatense TaxID=1862640 RepID=A0AAV8U9Y1_9ROSI|nr:hypothetical protein K2173_012837 [Erythroxylum novogranatense]